MILRPFKKIKELEEKQNELDAKQRNVLLHIPNFVILKHRLDMINFQIWIL